MRLMWILLLILNDLCSGVVVKTTGIIRLELNAQRATGIWTATGNNASHGKYVLEI